jgi:glutamine phosphoribosylpyrophosphate amidotransferase
MCGLTGFISTKKLTDKQAAKRKAIYRALLLSMQARGFQSTGQASITDSEVIIDKKAVAAEDFIKLKTFKKSIGKDINITMGHTRFATKGSISDRNAHPFVKGKIVGTHNGQVFDFNPKIDDGHEVDSELIFNAINKYEKLQKALNQVNGNVAIAWINTEHLTELNLFTDGGNDIFICEIKELHTYFYASTSEALELIMACFYREPKTVLQVPESTHLIITTKNEIIEKALTITGYYKTTYDFDFKRANSDRMDNDDEISCDNCLQPFNYKDLEWNGDFQAYLCEPCWKKWEKEILEDKQWKDLQHKS